MQATTLSFSNLHQHGDLFANLLRVRRQNFIVRSPWEQPAGNDMEFDQYDTPQSRWVAIHDRGEVMAGIRLTPTTVKCGVYSYLIRDAQRGILGGAFPSDLLYDEAPVANHVWEGSRLFVNDVVPVRLRQQTYHMLLSEMARSARELGATQLIGIGTAAWPRWAKRCNLDVTPIGRQLDLTAGASQCVAINLATKLH